ncbi:unknown [Eubacterium sp. CAG:252]|jgi:Tfp pilus assembly protein PilE|nr:unknown [Eubacterium sp. CAG:252]
MIGVIITIIVVICIIIIFSLIKVASYGEFLKDKKRNGDEE